MDRVIKFTVVAIKWFDKINGNTYHSVRCIRHKDNAVCVGSFRYGYGEYYRQTALSVMFDTGWFPKYLKNNIKAGTRKDNLERITKDNYYRYEMDNNYPILWTVSDGLKRDCIANGEI